jgi:hypothetical protein
MKQNHDDSLNLDTKWTFIVSRNIIVMIRVIPTPDCYDSLILRVSLIGNDFPIDFAASVFDIKNYPVTQTSKS